MLYTSTNHAPWLKPLNRVTSLFGSLIFYTIVLDYLAEFDDDDVFLGGFDPESREKTITASISASGAPDNDTTTRGKRKYWPDNGKTHPLANCACHTQPILKKNRDAKPATPEWRTCATRDYEPRPM